jgi:hypothetical protein
MNANIFQISGEKQLFVDIYIHATNYRINISKEKYEYIKKKMEKYEKKEKNKERRIYKYIISDIVDNKKNVYTKKSISVMYDKYLYDIYYLEDLKEINFPNLNKYDSETNLFEIIYEYNNIHLHLVKELYEKENYYCYLNIVMNNDKKKYIMKDFIYLQYILKF